MNETSPPLDSAPKWIRLVARVWSAPVIVFALIMAGGYAWSWLTTGVADPYQVEGTTFVEALPPILLFISILGLALAWRWAKLGGGFSLIVTAAVVLVLVIQGPTSADFSRAMVPYLLSLVVLIPGILFLIYGIRSGGVKQDRVGQSGF